MKITRKYVFLLCAVLAVFGMAGSVCWAAKTEGDAKEFKITFENSDTSLPSIPADVKKLVLAGDMSSVALPIDLSTYTSLTELEFDSVKFKALDKPDLKNTIVNHPDSLTKLVMSSSNVTSLGITSPKIKDVDLSKWSDITAFWAMETDSTGNVFKSKAENLTSLTLPSSCSKLEELGLTKTKVAKLDLSGARGLKNLWIANNDSNIKELTLPSDLSKLENFTVDYATYKSAFADGKRVILTKVQKDGSTVYKVYFSKVEGFVGVDKAKACSVYTPTEKKVFDENVVTVTRDADAKTVTFSAKPAALVFKTNDGNTNYNVAEIADSDWAEEKITITGDEVSVRAGETATMKFAVEPTTAEGKAAITIADSAIASCGDATYADGKGTAEIKGLTAGSTTATVKFTPSGDYASYSVTEATIKITVTAPITVVSDDKTSETLADLLKKAGIDANAEEVEIKNAEKLKSLEGIEKLLPNLKSLTLSGCGSLSEIDVTKCAKLETLAVSNCETLETVNVKGLATLVTLSLTGCRGVTELDVSKCSKLVTLNCGECGIESLTAEECLSLVSMDCHANSLGYFDVSSKNMPKLKELICGAQTRDDLAMTHSGGRYSVDLSAYAGGTSAGSVNVASVSGVVADSVKGFDSDGTKIDGTYDASKGTVSFASQPAYVAYDYDTGFNDVKMDVKVSGDGVTEKSGGSSPSSGCNAGLGVLALAIVPVVMMRKGRK